MSPNDILKMKETVDKYVAEGAAGAVLLVMQNDGKLMIAPFCMPAHGIILGQVFVQGETNRLMGWNQAPKKSTLHSI